MADDNQLPSSIYHRVNTLERQQGILEDRHASLSRSLEKHMENNEKKFSEVLMLLREYKAFNDNIMIQHKFSEGFRAGKTWLVPVIISLLVLSNAALGTYMVLMR